MRKKPNLPKSYPFQYSIIESMDQTKRKHRVLEMRLYTSLIPPTHNVNFRTYFPHHRPRFSRNFNLVWSYFKFSGWKSVHECVHLEMVRSWLGRRKSGSHDFDFATEGSKTPAFNCWKICTDVKCPFRIGKNVFLILKMRKSVSGCVSLS